MTRAANRSRHDVGTRGGTVEKRFLDGTRQFVRFDLQGEHVVSNIMQSEA